MKVSVKQQVDLTLKFLITLLAEPKITGKQLAKVLGVSEGWVYMMTQRLRDAGLRVEYDRGSGGQWSIGLTPALQEGILGKFSSRLKRQLTQQARKLQPVSFVSSLDRYTIVQFAQYLGTSPQNISNMLQGYKGQSLPEGWVGFQLSESGKWFIQKMNTDRTGKKYTLPDNVKNAAYSYVIGKGSMKVRGPKPAFTYCLVPTDGHKEPVLAKGLCSYHYYQYRRHPELMTQWERDARLAKRKAS